MSVEACAALLERGDAARFSAVMAAPVAQRGRLFVLFAFNLEIARAPWVTREPMIAEMRLQWWRDVVAGAAAGDVPLAHEVAGPLQALIREAGLPVAVLDRMVAARQWDIYREAFEGEAGFSDYLEDTSAGLYWLAARACGAEAGTERAVRAFGWAAGLAGFLRAVPELEARGCVPLVDGQPEAVAALARQGLAINATARAGLRGVPGFRKMGAAALLAGWQAEALLRQVARDGGIVARGGMGLSEFGKRGRLVWAAFSGRI